MAYVEGYVLPVSVPLAELAAPRRLAVPSDAKRMSWNGFKPMVSLVR